MASKQSKADEVTRLVNLLKKEAESPNGDQPQILQALTQLKQYGRDPQNADALYSKEGLTTLATYGFVEPTTNASREALRCIANALLLDLQLRQFFVDLGLPKKAANAYKNSRTDDDEFLTARILFLLTYGTNVDLEELLSQQGLALSLNNRLRSRDHVYKMQILPKSEGMPPPLPDDKAFGAISESLKLLFNLSNAGPRCVDLLQPCVYRVFTLWYWIPVPDGPLQAPFSHLINALINFDLNGEQVKPHIRSVDVFPGHDGNLILRKMKKILQSTIREAVQPQQQRELIPLFTILRKMYEVAPLKNREYMQENFLPAKPDRDLPIGQSDTLPSQLLQLSTSTSDLIVREVISSLMFEMSDSNAQKYIENVGYGYAAGYLATHNISVPDIANTAYRQAQKGGGATSVNPITGQRLDKEPVDALLPMTEEEKEREAEKLFVLFERLRATGVVDVKNPLQEAMRKGDLEGRVEELEEDED